MRTVRAVLLSLLTACVPAVGSDEVVPADRVDGASPPAPSEPAEPAPDDAGPLELSLDGQAPGPVEELLLRAAGRDREPAHLERVGWSTDGRTFVHCRRLPGLDCSECRSLGRDGTLSSSESGPGCSGTSPALVHQQALAPATTRWQGGTDVVLVVETREQETTNAGEPRPMLKLGARRREGGPPAWLIHVDPCQGCGTDQVCAAAAHLDALALSPDGEQLAVLIHQRSSQGDESMRVELLATARVAAAARTPASHSAP